MNDTYVGQSPIERGDHDGEPGEPMPLDQAIFAMNKWHIDGNLPHGYDLDEAWNVIRAHLAPAAEPAQTPVAAEMTDEEVGAAICACEALDSKIISEPLAEIAFDAFRLGLAHRRSTGDEAISRGEVWADIDTLIARVEQGTLSRAEVVALVRRKIEASWEGRAAPTADSMVSVVAEDANNYCLILRALGMEEEGDPVAEVERLMAAAYDQGTSDAGVSLTEAPTGDAIVGSWPWLRGVLTGMPSRDESIGGQRQRYLNRDEVLAWIDEGEKRATAPTVEQAGEVDEAAERVAFEADIRSGIFSDNAADHHLRRDKYGVYKAESVEHQWDGWLKRAIAQPRPVGVPDGWEIDEDGRGFVRIKSLTNELHIGYMPTPSAAATTMLRDLACAMLAAATATATATAPAPAKAGGA